MIGTIQGKSNGTYLLITNANFNVGDQVDVKLHREIRTLKENAFFHKLVEILAEKNEMSLDRMKNELVSSYGKYEYIGDKIPTYKVKTEYNDAMWERSDIHWKPIDYEVDGDQTWTVYALMRHTRDLDTKEMSTLIKGTLQECKNVLTDPEYAELIVPEDIARLL